MPDALVSRVRSEARGRARPRVLPRAWKLKPALFELFATVLIRFIVAAGRDSRALWIQFQLSLSSLRARVLERDNTSSSWQDVAFTSRAIVPQLISIAITHVIRFYIAQILVILLSRLRIEVRFPRCRKNRRSVAGFSRINARAFASHACLFREFFPLSMIPSLAMLAALSILSARVGVNVVIKLPVSRNVHLWPPVRASLSASSICRAQTRPSLLAAESILSTVFVF